VRTELLQKNQSGSRQIREEILKKHEVESDFDKRTTKLNGNAVNLEIAADFSQWDMELFVDNETTDDEKHTLSTRY